MCLLGGGHLVDLRLAGNLSVPAGKCWRLGSPRVVSEPVPLCPHDFIPSPRVVSEPVPLCPHDFIPEESKANGAGRCQDPSQ